MESIIPEKAVFSPLSFIFWRGIIWTPEMWGKGLPEELFFGGVFGDPFWDPAWVPKWVKKLLIFGFNFRLFFLGLLELLGCLLGAFLSLLRLS